jgi:predicted Zn-dependent peptidase
VNRALPALLAALACGPGTPKVQDPLAGVQLHDPTVARARPEALPPRPFTTPKAEKRTLSNGLQVIVATNDEVPLVTLSIALRVGEHTAPSPGLASATFAMLDKGAGDMDSAEIARRLKALASSLGAGAGDDGASITISSLRRNLEPTLDLLATVLREPTFPENDWKVLQNQYVSAIRNARKDPTAIARRVQDVPFHGDAYRGRVTLESHFEGMSPAAMRAWYGVNVGPENAIVLVGGAITADEVVPMLEARLGAWKPAGIVAPTARLPEPENVALRVLRSAREISERLGWRPRRPSEVGR